MLSVLFQRFRLSYLTVKHAVQVERKMLLNQR